MSHPPLKLGTLIRQKAPPIRKPRPPPEGLFCVYPHRPCMQNRLEGYEYCAKHILEDKNSVYKQCNYMSGKTGKRCPCAAPKSDKKEGYCMEHSRRSQFLRHRVSRKRRPRETPETLLEQIEHYGSKCDGGRDMKRGRPSNESITSRILEYASSSDSETEQQLVDQAWRGDVDSDAESIDSEQEDSLKHAGVYTAEEVALITKDKLIRLQSLYIEQFKRLQHIMREKRRRYLHTAKIERETLGSIHAAREDPEQRETYEKLIAMKRYHKRYGKEALLHRQSKERRISASEGASYKPPSYPKCQHVSDGSKCMARTVPLSKFCLQHIMDDAHQVLYQPCALGGHACGKPTPGIGSMAFCTTHTQLTEFKKRYPPEGPHLEEQQIEEKDHIDVVNDADVKTEITVETTELVAASSGSNQHQLENQNNESEDKMQIANTTQAQTSNHTTSRPTSTTPSQSGSQPPSRTSSRPPSRGSRPQTPQSSAAS